MQNNNEYAANQAFSKVSELRGKFEYEAGKEKLTIFEQRLDSMLKPFNYN